jgi:hypothetical protein
MATELPSVKTDPSVTVDPEEPLIQVSPAIQVASTLTDDDLHIQDLGPRVGTVVHVMYIFIPF